MQKYDVAIIGGGPAGATCAGLLASRGISTAVIEKSKFPKRKVCAGGVTFKAKDYLPINISSVAEKTVEKVFFRIANLTGFERDSNDILMWTLKRDALDAKLIDKARENGADILEEAEILSVEELNDRLVLKMKSCGQVESSIVIGADGASGFSARMLGFAPVTRLDFGIEGTCQAGTYNADAIEIEWGIGRSIYAWLFPRNSDASAGIKGPFAATPLLTRFMKRNVSEIEGLKGHVIPYRLKKKRIASENGLLIGDAAGLADPWMGEGIFNALRSAHFAAESVEKKLKYGASLVSYQETVDKEILPEQKASAFFQNVFNAGQRFFFDFVKRNDWAWATFCRIVRGERCFSDYYDLGRLLKNSLNP